MGGEFGDRGHGSAHLNEAPPSSAGSWAGPRPMGAPSFYEDSNGGMSFSPEEEVAAEDKCKPGSNGGRYPARAPAGPPGGAGPPGSRSYNGAPVAPPRGRQNVSCVNYVIKGHTIAERREPQVDKDTRPCFICGQGGHQSHKCQKKHKPQLSVAEGNPETATGRAYNLMIANEEAIVIKRGRPLSKEVALDDCSPRVKPTG